MTEPRLKPGFLPVNIFQGAAMPADCANCPFKMAEEGAPYLTRERYTDILFAVCLGQTFYCHKTVLGDKRTRFEEDPDSEGFETPESFARHYRMCNGAKRWAQMVADGQDPIEAFLACRHDRAATTALESGDAPGGPSTADCAPDRA